MSLTRITPYASVVEGDQHFADKLHTYAWDDSTQDQQNRALTEATTRMNRLNYRGQPTVSTQANAFPRDGLRNPWTGIALADGTTPDDIKRACIELAYSLLEGKEPEEEFDNLQTKSLKKNLTTFRPSLKVLVLRGPPTLAVPSRAIFSLESQVNLLGISSFHT
jgi:hypothetical protein